MLLKTLRHDDMIPNKNHQSSIEVIYSAIIIFVLKLEKTKKSKNNELSLHNQLYLT